MPVIVNNGSSRAVVIDRARVAAIADNRPEVREVSDQRTSEAVTRALSAVQVSSPGPQGAAGAPGGTSETRIASEALGGHRVVRSTGAGTVGYASSDNATHGDDTVGMTLGAAGIGAEVTVQRFGAVTFNGWAWTPGQPVFLGTNGLPTQVPPTTGFVQMLGHAESATTLYLDIQPAVYLD